MRRIVGVHGIWNWNRHREPGDAATALADVWGAALAGAPGLDPGVAKLLDVAYYSHRLRREVGQGTDDPYAMDEELREQLSVWAQELPLPQEVGEGALTLPVRQAIERMARYSGVRRAVIEPFVAVALREVRTYFRDRRARRAARDEVIDTLDRSGATIVLAHSLGSVVTYEALLAATDLHLDLLVTMGSPLGLPGVVFDRLEPGGAHASPLPNVARWVNIADIGDFVAVPRKLRDTFTGIHRDEEVTIGAVAFHQVDRYLRSSVVGEEVGRVLAAGPE